MKNSSLVYDIKRLLIYVVTLSITILIISKLFNFSVWLEVAVFISLQFILIYNGLKKISTQVELLPGIISLAREIGEGKFDGRVTNINESTELGVLAWTLNDVLDQLEAFTREMKTTVEYMSQGKFFRKLQSTGMHGQFLTSMLSVENAILITENKTKAEQEYLMRNVQLLLQNMDRLANGDLTVRVEKEKDDVIGSLFNGFNSVVANMQAMIIQVTEAVHATASASSQISASSDEMALGAQEQTRQTAEVAVAVEQMTKTIIETSTNVTRASEAAKESGNIARDGGSVVNDTINGMNRIAEVVIQAADMVKELGTSSDKIGEIVQVIDDIADQTNLLALNAAIEAARAGEQGRGFAVVADEVRKLAERTTKATKEIAQMIKKIQTDTENAVYSMEKGSQEVNSGKQLAQRAESALNQIITSSSEVVDDISQVAAASEEQSSAAEQISKNIESISRVTQESASGIQQIATAAEDLNQLTNNLQEMVGRFVINNQNKSQSKRTNLLRK
jgi:methyl-accepting chemotaxis protein